MARYERLGLVHAMELRTHVVVAAHFRSLPRWLEILSYLLSNEVILSALTGVSRKIDRDLTNWLVDLRLHAELLC